MAAHEREAIGTVRMTIHNAGLMVNMIHVMTWLLRLLLSSAAIVVLIITSTNSTACRITIPGMWFLPGARCTMNEVNTISIRKITM